MKNRNSEGGHRSLSSQTPRRPSSRPRTVERIHTQTREGEARQHEEAPILGSFLSFRRFAVVKSDPNSPCRHPSNKISSRNSRPLAVEM